MKQSLNHKSKYQSQQFSASLPPIQETKVQVFECDFVEILKHHIQCDIELYRIIGRVTSKLIQQYAEKFEKTSGYSQCFGERYARQGLVSLLSDLLLKSGTQLIMQILDFLYQLSFEIDVYYFVLPEVVRSLLTFSYYYIELFGNRDKIVSFDTIYIVSEDQKILQKLLELLEQILRMLAEENDLPSHSFLQIVYEIAAAITTEFRRIVNQDAMQQFITDYLNKNLHRQLFRTINTLFNFIDDNELVQRLFDEFAFDLLNLLTVFQNKREELSYVFDNYEQYQISQKCDFNVKNCFLFQKKVNLRSVQYFSYVSRYFPFDEQIFIEYMDMCRIFEAATLLISAVEVQTQKGRGFSEVFWQSCANFTLAVTNEDYITSDEAKPIIAKQFADLLASIGRFNLLNELGKQNPLFLQ